MGLFNFIKGQLINVIEWTDDEANDLMVYRFPVDGKEIKNGAQLTVRESQVAIFVNEGEIADVFNPGRYKLTTENLPVLTKLQSWKYGFNSPFKAEVYFVNTRQFTGLKWGTANPFALRDAEFGVVRIRAFGTYSLQVHDAAMFLKQAFGTAKQYSVKSLTDYSKSIIVSSFTDFLAEQKMPVLDIPQKYEEIGIGATNGANNTFAQLGVKIKDVIVENISLPDAVEKAIDERSSMGVIGNMNTYTSYKAANALSDAAKNQGGAAGMGVGLGAGVGFGQMMGNAMNNASNAKNANVICPHCNASVPEGKFCPECGKPLVVEKAKCIKCGATINKGAKFCPECGAKQEISKVTCPKCHAQVDENVKFCPECGEKLN